MSLDVRQLRTNSTNRCRLKLMSSRCMCSSGARLFVSHASAAHKHIAIMQSHEALAIVDLDKRLQFNFMPRSFVFRKLSLFTVAIALDGVCQWILCLAASIIAIQLSNKLLSHFPRTARECLCVHATIKLPNGEILKRYFLVMQ